MSKMFLEMQEYEEQLQNLSLAQLRSLLPTANVFANEVILNLIEEKLNEEHYEK